MNDQIKQAYLDKMDAQLREVTAKVEVVKARVAKGSANIQLDFHKRMEAWGEKETSLKTKMDELRAAGVDRFDAMKTGVQDIWNDVTTLITSIEENKNNEKH
jgi:hypothetical protein